jgi:hypothetical protein
LEKIAEFLEPFKDIMVKMSASLNSTVFWIIPLFNIIIDHVEDAASAVEVENGPGKLLRISIVFIKIYF